MLPVKAYKCAINASTRPKWLQRQNQTNNSITTQKNNSIPSVILHQKDERINGTGKKTASTIRIPSHTTHRLLFKPLPIESTRGNNILHYRMVLMPHETWQFIFFSHCMYDTYKKILWCVRITIQTDGMHLPWWSSAANIIQGLSLNSEKQSHAVKISNEFYISTRPLHSDVGPTESCQICFVIWLTENVKKTYCNFLAEVNNIIMQSKGTCQTRDTSHKTQTI